METSEAGGASGCARLPEPPPEKKAPATSQPAGSGRHSPWRRLHPVDASRTFFLLFFSSSVHEPPFCRLRCLAACLACFAAFADLPARDPAKAVHVRFDLPAADAVSGLRRFVAQSGVQLVYPGEAVADVRTKAVRGTLLPREALVRMLEGSGLTVEEEPRSGALILRRLRSGEGEAGSAGKSSTDPPTQTPKSMNSHRPASRLSALLALVLLPGVHGQESSSSSEPSVVQLSPFQVSSERDVGYAASSTLAGSRLNTELLNTPAAISVFTKDFLDDIGALDVKDALEYAMNAGPDYSDFTGNQVSSNSMVFQMRGFVGASLGRNYFTWFNASDSYNIERIDMSRGPNSILFGIGGPGGILNTTTKQARFDRDINQVQLRVGSFDDYRATVDVNRSLGEKFAIRANLLWQDRESWREFEFYKRKGAALALTFRPLQNTTIRFDSEFGTIKDNRAQPWPAADRLTPWLNAGSPLSQTYGQAVTGTGNISFQGYVYTPDLGAIRILGGRQTNAGPGAPSLGNNPIAITDESLLPKTTNLRGPGQINDVEYYNWALFLEQRIGRNLDLELAFNRQKEDQENFNVIVFDGVALRADPNALLRDGSPNPNAGRFYVEGHPNLGIRDQRRDDYRATLSYQLDLRGKHRWLGQHRFAAMLSQRDSFNLDDGNIRPVNANPLTNLANGDLTNSNNQLWRRSYLDFSSSDPALRGLHDPRKHPVNDPNGVIEKYVRVGNSGRDARTMVDSRMIALQSAVFDNRLWLTAGFRKDRQRSWGDGNATREPVINTWNRRIRNPNADLADGNTRTYGVVFHVNRTLSLYYNNADNFLPSSTRSDLIDNNLLGHRTGVGQDVGLKLNLFNDRVRANIGWYETNDTNREQGIDNAWTNNINAIWRTLGDDTRVLGANGDTQDLAGKGYEFEVTANLTKGWRTTFNWSITQQFVSKMQPRRQAYIAANRSIWEANANVLLDATGAGVPVTDALTGGPSTVATALRTADAIIAGVLAGEGQIRRGLREHAANVFTNYSFQGGALKGFSVGAGANYRGKGVVGYDPTNGNAHVFGNDYLLVNGMVNYQKTFRSGRTWRIQLNVDNMLGEDDLIITDADQIRPYRYVYQNPRRWSITNTFTF